MSLNTSHAGKDGVVLFNSERIFIYHDGVELSFDKASDDRMKGKKSGRIYLTTHRVIFVNKDNKDKLLSLSMPFYTMKKLELEQPVFGANYIAGVVKAEQGANWQGEAKFKLVFYKGGAIEFGQAMLQAGKLASRYAPPQPPTYSPPMAPYYEAPPPAYTPQMQYGGIYPSPVFNVQPPPGSVYMYDIPPPYPGVDPNLPPYPISQPAQPFSVPQYPGQSQYPGGTQPQYPTAPYPGGGQPQYPPQYPMGPPQQGQPQYPSQPSYNPQFTTSQNASAAAKEAEAFGYGGQTNGGQGYGGQGYYDPAHPQNLYLPPPSQAPPPQYDAGAKKND